MSDLTEQASDTPIIDSCVKSADRYGDSDVVPVRVARELERGTNRLRAEVVQLRQWKESALSIMPDWQELGRLLNCTLGEDVPLLLLPRIRELRAEVDRLKSDAAIDITELQLRIQRHQREAEECQADLQAARKVMEMAKTAMKKASPFYDLSIEVAALNAELEKSK